MSDLPQNPGPEGQPAQPAGDPATYSQKFSHAPVAARVPEKVGKGVFSTGICIQDTPTEFIVDFLQSLSRPAAIVARVIITPPVMGGFVQSLRENLNRYIQSFGAPTPLPKPPPNQPKPSIQEIYEHFKMPEDLYSGSYANSFLIAHGPSEFCFDFITGFFPTAAVSCRAYLSAQQIPRMLDTLNMAFIQHQQRYANFYQGQPPQAPPAPEAPPQNPKPE